MKKKIDCKCAIVVGAVTLVLSIIGSILTYKGMRAHEEAVKYYHEERANNCKGIAVCLGLNPRDSWESDEQIDSRGEIKNGCFIAHPDSYSNIMFGSIHFGELKGDKYLENLRYLVCRSTELYMSKK